MASRKIEVEILGDASSLNRALGTATSKTSKFGKAAKVALIGGAAAGLYALGKAAKIGFDEFSQGQKVAAQTNAVIKSTGNVANVSAKHVEDLGKALMMKSGIDDEVIKSGENMLLTFTNIRNELGKGNDIFDQTTKLTLDMSVAMGKDLTSSAIMVGKALNDPIAGLTSLSRVGVKFTQDTKDQITALVENGKTMQAQKVILHELATEFGGSAAAAGRTFSGQINILRERFNNWAGDMVANVIPTVETFIRFLNRIINADGFKAKISVVISGVKEAAGDLLDQLRKVLFGERKPLKLPSGQIIEWVQTQGLVSELAAALAAVNWKEVGETIGAGISKTLRITNEFVGRMFTQMSDAINSNLDKFAELGAKLIATIVAKLLDPIFWAKNWKVAIVVATAVIPIGKVAGLGARLAGLLGRAFGKELGVILEHLVTKVILRVGAIFERLPKVVRVVIDAIAKAFLLGIKGIIEFIHARFGALPGWLQGVLKAAFRVSVLVTFISWVQKVIQWIRELGGVGRAVLGGIAGAFNALIGPIKTVIGWVQQLIGWLQRAAESHAAATGLAAGPGPSRFGHRAMGGPVSGRTPYIVGERGPELFVPRSSGRIIPNGAGGGGGSVRVIVLGGDREAINYLRQLDERVSRRSGRGVL